MGAENHAALASCGGGIQLRQALGWYMQAHHRVRRPSASLANGGLPRWPRPASRLLRSLTFSDRLRTDRSRTSCTSRSVNIPVQNARAVLSGTSLCLRPRVPPFAWRLPCDSLTYTSQGPGEPGRHGSTEFCGASDILAQWSPTTHKLPTASRLVSAPIHTRSFGRE